MRTLTLGVLVCDSVKPELQSVAGDYPQMFEQLFRDYPVAGYLIKLIHYDVRSGRYPERLSECDGYLTTGSAASVNDDDQWILELLQFVRCLHAEQVKLFAVCFGHQLIGKALGGKVEVAEQGWAVGVHEATVQHREPWMRPAADSYRLISSHKEQVTVVPPGVIVLASSLHCPCSMMQCGSLLGIQGHPEFRAPYAQALMDTRTAIIPEDTRIQAAESFQAAPPDHSLFTEWIVRFVLFCE
ncbi:MAG: hypothetical protein KDN22_03720 [Verrucomicrobiae bacterium]|nr:hypothetical protein [Verrucomicrobiae bacterium]